MNSNKPPLSRLKLSLRAASLLGAALLAAGCAQLPASAPKLAPAPKPQPTAQQVEWARRASIAPEAIGEMLNKPWFKMSPTELGPFLAYQQQAKPDLRQRIAELARKNIGQPYELYLLGEFPYETYDSQPLFNLEKSDCVVFVEHVYAMALSSSWEEFFWMLQRIRYQDGVIGTATRNHYTEADWNVSNRWLVQDITASLAGTGAVSYSMQIDRKAFLKKQFKIDREIPKQRWDDVYLPKEMLAQVASQLQDGDFINVISGNEGGKWASHVGLVVIGADGVRNIVHSAEPMVREESLQSFIDRAEARDARNAAAGKNNAARLFGFKLLRLHEKPEAPPMAPQPRPAPAKLLG
jgi:hypothetical protein